MAENIPLYNPRGINRAFVGATTDVSSTALNSITNGSSVLATTYHSHSLATLPSILPSSDDINRLLEFYSSGRWEDLRIAADMATRGTLTPPSLTIFKNGLYGWAFDAAAMNEVFFDIQLPHIMKEGTTLKPHVHWSMGTSTTGNVVWGLEWSAASIYGNYTTSQTIRWTQAGAGSSLYHNMTTEAEMQSTAFTHSAMIKCRLFRDSTNAADNSTADAFWHEIDFHFRANRFGTLNSTGDPTT